MPATPELRFTAPLSEADRGGGRWVEVPPDAREIFGEARPPVTGTVNGHPYRSRLAVYGGRTYLGILKNLREQLEIELGDEVAVVLRRDDSPREITIPAELEQAFRRAPDARGRFDALAFTHRREYANWVGNAKREETRATRAAKAIEMLRAGTKHP
jgi:hypothetical protein